MNSYKPSKDKNFHIGHLQGSMGIPISNKLPIINNLGLDSLISWQIDSLGFSVTDNTLHDTLEQRLRIYNSKMCYCQFKEKEKRKEKCNQELNFMGNQLLGTLFKNVNQLDNMNSEMIKLIYNVYSIKLDTINKGIQIRKYKFYNQILSKNYPCKLIEFKIDSFCNTISVEFDKEYKNFINFKNRHPNSNINDEYSNLNCKLEFEKIRNIICNACDTAQVIKGYCTKKGLKFNSEKCECIVNSPPQTAKTLQEVRNSLKSTCNKITTEVSGVNAGKDILISMLYSADSNFTCFGGSKLSKGNYGIGEYDIPTDLYEYINNHFIDTLEYLFTKHNWLKDSVLVNVIGFSDGYGINLASYKNEKLNIPYKGYKNIEIKDPVQFSAQNYLIIKNYNDTNDCGFQDFDEEIIFNKNNEHKIQNNIQLAYLRAYPVKHILKNNFPQTKIYAIEMKNSNKEGTYRKIEIHLLIIGATIGMNGLDKNRNTWLYRMKNCSDKN